MRARTVALAVTIAVVLLVLGARRILPLIRARAEENDKTELRRVVGDYLNGSLTLDSAAVRYNTLMDAIGMAQMRRLSGGPGSKAVTESLTITPSGVAENDPRVVALLDRAGVLRFGETRYRLMQQHQEAAVREWRANHP